MSKKNKNKPVNPTAMKSGANLTDNRAILRQYLNSRNEPEAPAAAPAAAAKPLAEKPDSFSADAPKAPVVLTTMTPQRSAKAAGLSSVLQIGNLLVFVTPGSHHKVVIAEKYDEYHNYINGEFETAPVDNCKSFVVTKPLFPAPPPVKHIKHKDAPEKKPSENDDSLDKGNAAKNAPATEKPEDRPIAIVDDPRFYGSHQNVQTTVRQDLLGQKGALEKRYFGKEFPDDNIHIQLIHNILDIDKILAPFVNSIAETLNRMNPEVTKIDAPAEEERFNGIDAVEAANPTVNLDGVKNDMIGNFYLGNPLRVFLLDDKDAFQRECGTADAKIDAEWAKQLVKKAQLEAFVQYPRMSYFGNTFYSQELRDKKLGKVNGKKSKNPKPLTEEEKEKQQQDIEALTAELRKKLYYALWLISLARHSMAHSDEQRDVLFLLDSPLNDSVWNTFYNSQKFNGHDPKTALKEAKEVLDKIYSNKLESINQSFLKNASTNLSVIADALKEDVSQKLVNEYYLFAEQKQHRNTSYSIKQLRELLIRTDVWNGRFSSARTIRNAFGQENYEKKLSSERQKLNTILDFIIWRYYTANAPKDANGIPIESSREELDFIRKLRGASLRKSNSKLGSVGDILFFTPKEDAKWREDNLSHYSGKDAKEAINAEMDSIIAKREIYRKEAAIVWASIHDQVWCAVRNIQPKKLKDHRKNVNLPLALKDYGSCDHYFSKLMYLLTIFLDGKEINTLLTQLASQFDSIADYWEILESLRSKGLIIEAEHPDFLPEYSLFRDSRQIAKELRKVNSIARMTKGDKVDAMRVLFYDATRLLGWNGDDDSMKAFVNEHLDSEHLVKYEELAAAQEADPNQVLYTTGYRNFIVSNVIDNNRFRYMVRYGNPGALKKLVSNKVLVEFVLNRLPSDQLKRYYDSYWPNQSTKDDRVMVRVLSEAITGFSADKLAGIQTDRKISREETLKTEKYKILVSLYLTVLYQIVKNLVNINSRYFLAFHLVERDATLKYPARKIDYIRLTKDALEKEPITKSEKRFHRYLEQETIDAPTKTAIKNFRNNVEHLNIIRALCEFSEEITSVNSYFALYHFLMQRWLTVKYPNPGFESKYKDRPLGAYCKDKVKTLCYPFGYNLARYKNLTVDGLFDMNERIPNAKPKKDPDIGLPDVLYYQTTGGLPKSGVIKPGLFFDRKENKYKKRTTTFYQKNTRITGAFIRLTEQPNEKPHKDGRIPSSYRVDAKKIVASKELRLEFFKGDDGGWYIKYIPRDCLTPV